MDMLQIAILQRILGDDDDESDQIAFCDECGEVMELDFNSDGLCGDIYLCTNPNCILSYSEAVE